MEGLSVKLCKEFQETALNLVLKGFLKKAGNPLKAFEKMKANQKVLDLLKGPLKHVPLKVVSY